MLAAPIQATIINEPCNLSSNFDDVLSDLTSDSAPASAVEVKAKSWYPTLRSAEYTTKKKKNE